MGEKIKFDSNINEVGYLILGNDRYSAFLNFNLKEKKPITVEFKILNIEYKTEDKIQDIIGKDIKFDFNYCHFITENAEYSLYSSKNLVAYNIPPILFPNKCLKYCIYFDYCLAINYDTEINFKKNKFNKIYLKFKDLDQFCNRKKNHLLMKGKLVVMLI